MTHMYRQLHIPAPVPRRPLRDVSPPPPPLDSAILAMRRGVERPIEEYIRRHGLRMKLSRDAWGDLVRGWFWDALDDSKRARFELDLHVYYLADNAATECASIVSRKADEAIESVWDSWFDPDRWEPLGELLSA